MKKLITLMVIVLAVAEMLSGCLSNKKTVNDWIFRADGEKTNVSSSVNTYENITKSENSYVGPYTVTRVVDGDTIIVNIDGEDTRVRMIGVDTPESVSSDKTKNCKEGTIASDYTKSELTGEKVYLEYDEDMYDKYDRVLAYVYTYSETSAPSMFNEVLLTMGYARTMTIKPNVKYAESFKRIEDTAKLKGEGFWSSDIW